MNCSSCGQQVIYDHKRIEFFRALLCIERELYPYSNSYSLFSVCPGSFPGFRAKIMGLDDSRATAEPKINPLASIEIIASAFYKNWFEAIFKIRSLKISGY